MKSQHDFDLCSIDLQRKRKLLNTFDTEVTALDTARRTIVIISSRVKL